MTLPDVLATLAALGAVGVGLRLNAAGDGLTLTGKGKPPAELLAAVKLHKLELLEVLRAKSEKFSHLKPTPAKEEAASSPSPDARAAEVVSNWDNPRPAPDWATLSVQPGHCGSCARFTPAPDWGPFMGECGASVRAWQPDTPPLSIHMGHACPLQGAAGYRAASSGKPHAPRPLERRA